MHHLHAAVLTGLALAAVAAAETYTIDIGGPMDELFIRDGWYGPEGPYPQYGPVWHDTVCRWARQGAVVRIPAFPGAANVIEMRGEVRGDAQQRMRWFLGDELVAELPISDDLLYRAEVPAATLSGEPWARLRIETLAAHPAGSDSRDLRVAVDWIKVSADAPRRNVFAEALAGSGLDVADAAHDRAPTRWRMRYDPNNVGSTFAPTKFNYIRYDDSAFEVVPTSFVPEMRRGDVAWYRAWLVIDGSGDEVRAALQLPGGELEPDGRREVWVNGVRIAQDAERSTEERAAAALIDGFNAIAVKVMKGPLPAPSGDALVANPELSGEWSPQRVVMKLGPLVLADEFTAAKRLRVRLEGPGGEPVGSAEGEIVDLGENRRGFDPGAGWALSEYGEHSLVIEDDAGHRQRFPIHFLGLHLFHWGWYSAAGGTTWQGFKPCSNDHLDELFERLSDWGRPHHSICWGGAILTPGTGFHKTEKVNYVGKFRDAIAVGQLQFVGMPFPPRNICTDFGESLLRSMRYSRALYESQLGTQPRRFYSHDANMTPLLPQIMRLCGYDTYCIAENWWGQGRSIPNSRDCYFRDAEGTRVRVLDSWYHGISPVTAARRAVEQGKPAVLCNEEFACLDRTVFLTPEHLTELAAEGIFLQPVTLDEYQRITDQFARELEYEGDEALCYKGWTGGGEGEVEFEKANRALETRLVALENLVAFARWLDIDVDQAPIDKQWDLSLRAHECHAHWGNGNRGTTDAMRKGADWAESEMERVGGLIAAQVTSEAEGIVVFNPLGLRRRGVVQFEAPEGVKALAAAGHEPAPVQPHPDRPGAMFASLPDLPSCGYRFYRFVEEPPTPGPRPVTATVNGDRATLSNGLITAQVAADGRIVSVTENDTGHELLADANRLYLARPRSRAPDEPLSTAGNPLNLSHYAAVTGGAPPRVLCQGPAGAGVDCTLVADDYPEVRLNARIVLMSGERQVRVNLVLQFAEPTVVFAGGRGPHEGTYFPGIFVAFPMLGLRPMADMAYCTTDGVLTSTNHETFMREPFRNGTFNCLSLAGPKSGEYAVLTRGLPDFFVVRQPTALLGMSLGLGAENCPYTGAYAHDYALFVPPADEREDMGHQAFLAARSFLVDPIAVPRGPGKGKLPPEGSFVAAELTFQES